MNAPTSGHVVVIDDERDVAEMLAFILQLEGHVVRTFSNGAEGLTSILESPPTLVVLDVMMPGIDGLEVLRVLKSDAATARIPVVILSAMAGDQDVWDGWAAGADYYLTKPFEPEQLQRYLRSLSDNARGLAGWS